MFKYLFDAALLAAPVCHAENKHDKPDRSSNIVWEIFCDYVVGPVVRPLDIYFVRPCIKYHIPDFVACACAIAMPFLMYYHCLLHEAHQYRLAELNKITQNQSLEVL